MASDPDPVSLCIEIVKTGNLPEYLKRNIISPNPGLPTLLAETIYFREFKEEANNYGFRLLKEKKYSPAAFASIMQRLSEKYEEKATGFSFISTHPITEERVKKARAAAQ